MFSFVVAVTSTDPTKRPLLNYMYIRFGLWCLTPLSTIFQLHVHVYRGKLYQKFETKEAKWFVYLVPTSKKNCTLGYSIPILLYFFFRMGVTVHCRSIHYNYCFFHILIFTPWKSLNQNKTKIRHILDLRVHLLLLYIIIIKCLLSL